MSTTIPRALNRILARPGETLTTHSLRVLERVEQLAALRPLPAFPNLYARLRWAALLHDSGKLARAFQRGLRNKKARWGLRHEVLSLAFLDWFDLPPEDRPWMIAAIATHHRDAPFILDRYRRDNMLDSLLGELEAEPVQAWYTWLNARVPIPAWVRPFQFPHAASIRQALNTLEAWFGALREQNAQHPDFAEAVLLRGTMLQADHAASAGARAFVPQCWSASPRPAGALYPHQAQCEALTAHDMLLIAPTGSGKTEAGLLWAGEESPRLFYSLPYRASMNAMRHRLTRYTLAENIGLQHGRALQALYRDLLAEGRAAPDAAQEAAARLNLARLHTCPVRVFSPYHLLQAAYQLKGFEANLTDCAGARLIVDEIHAYQPERLAMILATLAFLRVHFGTRLLIMSATLPRLIRQTVEQALPGVALVQGDPATYARFCRHRIMTFAGALEGCLDQVLAAQQAGKRVLVTVNTVRRARAISRLLGEQGCPVITLHGRFHHADRWRLEQEILARFAVNAESSAAVSANMPVVVATQVIEVSLNLSFDTLFSDPAPLDALIQRFGRVNRLPDAQHLAPVWVCMEPTGQDMRRPVYDPGLVQASAALLAQHSGQPLDEARVMDWLDLVYSGERAAAWQEAYAERRDAFKRFVLGELHPFEAADEGLFQQFIRLFDGVEVLPLGLEDEYSTRLKGDPVGASLLMVPVAFWQYKMLERARRAWQEGELYLTDADYTSAGGLALEEDDDA